MAKGIYVGVNNVARKVKTMYVGVNGVARKVKKVYVGVNGVARLCYSSSSVDPTKMSFTQDEFIQICNDGLQSQMQLGALITLNNTYCDTYEVIGVNHDGTSGTVDIMAHTQVGKMAFSSSSNTYSSSSVRTWINETYLSAFDTSIKNLAKTMSVKSATSLTAGTTLSDKVKLLSAVEMNYSSFQQYMPGYSSYKEGEPYTIFTRGTYDSGIADRWRGAGSYGNSSYFWLRTPYTNGSASVWRVSSGGYGDFNYTFRNSQGVLPVMRF